MSWPRILIRSRLAPSKYTLRCMHLARGFLAWCQEKGAQRVSVTAYAANVRAVEFYRRLGYEPRNVTLELGLDDLFREQA